MLGIIIFIISIIITWIIASVPVWLSAKLFSSKASLGKAMVATLVGLIAFFVLDRVISPFSHFIALIIGFLAVLWVFKTVFDVGWLSSLGITIVAFIITIVILVILAVLGLGLSLL
ncbi:hypothetical protein [Metallosphaera tengchongensis]|uniref:hypothetical protein n=1 Tax=Metallosphaera tengchongensis TaxID=1532350 RepID=UPI001FE7CCC3|nr:hypothetical protein [Metallosphaera tengchongensis]